MMRSIRNDERKEVLSSQASLEYQESTTLLRTIDCFSLDM